MKPLKDRMPRPSHYGAKVPPKIGALARFFININDITVRFLTNETPKK